MIARVWHGYTKPEHADEYESMLKPDLLPGLSEKPGFAGSYLLRRERGAEVEFVTIILWESLDSLKAVAGENYEHAIVPEERRRVLVRWDDTAVHYEVRATRTPGLGAA
jgi:heme-degrading monooxygenase HmoA